MSAPRISIIIPAYNSGKYIEDTLTSVCSQTFSDWECIVTDDGSSDGTRDTVRTFAEKDVRIRLICHEKNGGVAAARNTSIAAASGEYIAFLDADDIWEPEKLARTLTAAEGGAPIVYTGARFIADDGTPTERTVSVPERLSYKDMFAGNNIVTSSAMVRRDALPEAPFVRDDLHEDLILWASLLKEGGDAIGINAPLVRYRLADGSKSRGKLKSAATTWKTYRYLGKSFFGCIGAFVRYALHGIKRYFG